MRASNISLRIALSCFVSCLTAVTIMAPWDAFASAQKFSPNKSRRLSAAKNTSSSHTKKSSEINVLLITVDTLRADHVSCYSSAGLASLELNGGGLNGRGLNGRGLNGGALNGGGLNGGEVKSAARYQGPQTPAIDSLAREGVFFERAVSQVPLTLASHASILTGTYPFHNGVQDFTGEPLSPSFETVAQAFRRNGYSTAAVVSSFVLDRSWGLARGFDFYQDAFAPQSFLEKNVALVERRAGESVDKAIQWLQDRPAKPFFLWLHLYDPHSPYDPPEPFRSRYKDDLYSGEIAYADSQLERLFAFLKKNALYDSSAIVLLSDHGESLGEHGEREHGFFVYESTLRVPLAVKPPLRLKLASHRVGWAVEALSVAPTLLDLAGLKDPIQKQFESKSLLGLIVRKEFGGKESSGKEFREEESSEGSAYSETYYPFSSFGWSPLRSLQNSRYHYIQAPEAELYNLSADPEEKNNLVKSQVAVVSVFQEKLAQLSRQYLPAPHSSEGNTLSPEAIEKLRSLGYVAYRSPVSAERLAAGLPDPKSKLAEFNAILRAGDLLQAGNFAAGTSLLEDIRKQDPSMYIVPFMLGEAALRQSHWQVAATEFEQCLQLNPGFDQAMTGIARAYFQLGRLQDARRWLNQAIKTNDKNYRAWYELGWVESRSDPAAARRAFAQVLMIQPTFALAHRDLALLEYREKNYAQAAIHFDEAIHLGIKDKMFLNSAGIAANNTNNPTKAISYYKQALALDPNYAEAHLNLGLAYERAKQFSASRAEYATACRLKPKFCD